MAKLASELTSASSSSAAPSTATDCLQCFIVASQIYVRPLWGHPVDTYTLQSFRCPVSVSGRCRPLLCCDLRCSLIAGFPNSPRASAARKEHWKGKWRNSSPHGAEKDTHLSSFECSSPRPRMLFLPEMCIYRGPWAFKWSEPSASPFTRTPLPWPGAMLPLEASTRRGPRGAGPSAFTEGKWKSLYSLASS